MLDDKLVQAIADALEVSTSEITLKSGTGNVQAWDSLGHLKVILAVEDTFDVRFDTADIERLTSVMLLREELERRQAL